MAAGITIDSDISKGPSETYQLWIQDPDGNKIEIMQYTENSLQVKGNC
ncbi:VOC family protein [Robertmurraya korlensis]|nr:VOC family protein [Robertmurraya korlensis]MCM3600429.1 VOC family protein [Robertmurraya korlensis]